MEEFHEIANLTFPSRGQILENLFKMECQQNLLERNQQNSSTLPKANANHLRRLKELKDECQVSLPYQWKMANIHSLSF